MAEKGPSKGQKSKFRKTKNCVFFLMSQGVLCQKIRFLGQKLWPLAGEQTDRHTHTEISITEDTIRASVFKASASGMSCPITQFSRGVSPKVILVIFGVTMLTHSLTILRHRRCWQPTLLSVQLHAIHLFCPRLHTHLGWSFLSIAWCSQSSVCGVFLAFSLLLASPVLRSSSDYTCAGLGSSLFT